MGNILGAAGSTKPMKNKIRPEKSRNRLQNAQMSWGTFDKKHSFQAFGVVVFKHGEDLREEKQKDKETGRTGGTDDGSSDKPLRKFLWLVSRCASVRVPRSRRSVWWLRCSSPAEKRWKHITRRTAKMEGKGKRAGGPSKPSPTASGTPSGASPCVWSLSSWSPACSLTSGDLWDPEARSRRTRWDCPLCRIHTSLRTRTSWSPEGQGGKTEFGRFPRGQKWPFRQAGGPLEAPSRRWCCPLSSWSWTPDAAEKQRLRNTQIKRQKDCFTHLLPYLSDHGFCFQHVKVSRWNKDETCAFVHDTNPTVSFQFFSVEGHLVAALRYQRISQLRAALSGLIWSTKARLLIPSDLISWCDRFSLAQCSPLHTSLKLVSQWARRPAQLSLEMQTTTMPKD